MKIKIKTEAVEGSLCSEDEVEVKINLGMISKLKNFASVFNKYDDGMPGAKTGWE